MLSMLATDDELSPFHTNMLRFSQPMHNSRSRFIGSTGSVCYDFVCQTGCINEIRRRSEVIAAQYVSDLLEGCLPLCT